jgi:hypothetical protein
MYRASPVEDWGHHQAHSAAAAARGAVAAAAAVLPRASSSRHPTQTCRGLQWRTRWSGAGGRRQSRTTAAGPRSAAGCCCCYCCCCCCCYCCCCAPGRCRRDSLQQKVTHKRVKHSSRPQGRPAPVSIKRTQMHAHSRLQTCMFMAMYSWLQHLPVVMNSPGSSLPSPPVQSPAPTPPPPPAQPPATSATTPRPGPMHARFMCLHSPVAKNNPGLSSSCMRPSTPLSIPTTATDTLCDGPARPYTSTQNTRQETCVYTHLWPRTAPGHPQVHPPAASGPAPLPTLNKAPITLCHGHQQQ